MTKNNDCRTCFNAAKGWNLLTTKTKDCRKRLKSYGEILEEVTKINSKDNKYQELPQFICGNCSRRLKSAHNFIQQATEVNEKLYSMLNEKTDCLQETQIDLEPCIEIKRENNELEAKMKSLEYVQEIPVDIEPCIGINAKNDEQNRKKEKNHCLQEIQFVMKPGIDIKAEKDKQKQNFKMKGVNTDTNDFGTNSDEEIKQCETKNYYDDAEYLQSDGLDWEDCNKQTNKQIKKKKVISVDTSIAVPCHKCHKIFENSKLLAVHQRISHIPEEKKCTCHLCGNKFTRYCNMYKHMRTLHGPETVTLMSKRPEADYIYKCDKCPKKYSRKKSLIYHSKLKHSTVEIQEIKEDKTKNRDERKSADKGSLCPICGSSFTSKNQLTVHLRRHTGERPFKCDICDRAFLLVTQLNSHKRIHTGEKPYKCQLCGKAFRVSDDLRQHMRTHNNVRPFKCPQCERRFKHPQDLKIHLRSHTGERPHICAVCGDSFQRYNTLRSHRIRMNHLENSVDNVKHV